MIRQNFFPGSNVQRRPNFGMRATLSKLFTFSVLGTLLLNALTLARNSTQLSIVHPQRPAHGIELTLGSSRSIWCQFISHTRHFLRPEMFADRWKFIDRTDKYAVLWDDRENLAYFWSIPWILHMLGPEWAMQILAYESNKGFFQSIVDEFHLENVFIDTFENRYGYGAWISPNLMRKSQFLLAKQFWEGLDGEYILIVQDHGVPMKHWRKKEARAILETLYTYAYVGAPWSLSDTSALQTLNVSTMSPGADFIASPGGNGGFSLRKRSWAVRHGVDMKVDTRKLLSNVTKDFQKLGVAHEDWLWGQILARYSDGVAPKLLASKFSVELLTDNGSLGTHNFPSYHSPRETAQFVNDAAREFFNTGELDVFEIEEKPDEQEHWLESWVSLQQRFPNASLPMECNTP